MSFRVSAAVMYADLPHWHKSILHVLADHADDQGRGVYPSVERIALLAGRVSRRTVQRRLRELENDGFIHKVAEATFHRPVEYNIDVAKIETLRYPELGRPPVTQGRPPVETGASLRRIRGDSQTPKPVKQPWDEPVTNLPVWAKTTSGDLVWDSALWDAMVDICGLVLNNGDRVPPRFKNEQVKWQEAYREMIARDVTAKEFIQAAREYKKRWPDIAMTPTAILNNWTTLTQPVGRVKARVDALERFVQQALPESQ